MFFYSSEFFVYVENCEIETKTKLKVTILRFYKKITFPIRISKNIYPPGNDYQNQPNISHYSRCICTFSYNFYISWNIRSHT